MAYQSYKSALLVLRGRAQPVLDLHITPAPENYININSRALFIVENSVLEILSNVVRLSYDSQQYTSANLLQNTRLLRSEDRACA